MLNITVRDYRGAERADIVLDPIALVAGKNEQGKTSLAEAVRAALTGQAMIPDIPKKHADMLVRKGAAEGGVAVREGGANRIISWPKCEVIATEDAPTSSMLAVGMVDVVGLPPSARAELVAGYVDTQPGWRDLLEALTDAGWASEESEKVWALVQSKGWDGALKVVRDHVTKQKGLWESVTGEKKWGSKKAEGWIPHEGFVPADDSDQLEQRVAECSAALEDVIGRFAAADSWNTVLAQAAAEIPSLEASASAAETARAEALKAWQAMCATEPPKPPAVPLQCPHPECQRPVAIQGKAVVIAGEGPTPEQIETYAAWESSVNAAHDTLTAATDAAKAASAQLASARDAAAKLTGQAAVSAADMARQQDVDSAREALAAAQGALNAQRRWSTAANHHATIMRHSVVADLLAPEGLRRRKLAAGLASINDRLAGLCASAGWPVVRFDEDLDVHYGQRPYWLASASGQWRARTIIQIAFAMLDGSDALVIDEADILDQSGRNQLFGLLGDLGMKALVCMTISRKDLVPDIARAGLGTSYWVENGIVRPIAEAIEERAA